MNFYRLAAACPRGRAAIALLLGALLALAAPAWASAADFTVNGTGDGATQAACESGVGTCSLRGALEASVAAATGPNTIKFDPSAFNGEAGDTIVPTAGLPEATHPVTIDGSGCNAGSAVPCLGGTTGAGALLVLKAGESKVQHLSINAPAGVVGIRAAGSAGVGPGDEILDNTISMPGTTLPSTGIETALGSSGSLIEGNKITSVVGFNFSIALRGNSGRIFGNELIGGGCCQAGISLEIGPSGNQIGGDTAASENLIEGFAGGAIQMNNTPNDSTHNEVRRNRGENGSNFVQGASVAAPLITEALQSSASGTAEPQAIVRLFRKKTESAGEIEGFLGEAEADSSGDWEISFAKAPTDTLAAATQTIGGSTSGLGETKHLAEEPESEKEKAEKEQKAREEGEAAERAAREKEAAEKGGGDASGSGTGTGSPSPQPAAPSAPAPVKPKVTITKGPKKSSTSTTATFKFKANPAAGAKFECKLDRAKWAKCSSPKTYKKLKPGKHTFRVRAKANGLTGPVAKGQFTVKP